MRIGAAQRELSRSNGKRFLAPGYGCVPRAERLLSPYNTTVFPNGAYFYLVHWRRRFVVAWGDQRENDHNWGIYGALFGRSGADQASSYCGALRDFDKSSTRC